MMFKFIKSLGLSPLVAFLILIFLTAGIFVLVNNKSSSDKLSSGSEKDFKADCQLQDQNLCQFVKNADKKSNYKIHSITVFADGNQVESFLEYSGQDYSYIGKDNGKEVRVIKINDTIYTQDLDGKWFKTKNNRNLQNQEIPGRFQFSLKEVNTGTKSAVTQRAFKFLGKEPCVTLNCFKYQMINLEKSDEENYIWFDDKEYLIRRQLTKQENGSVFDVEYSYEPVNISVPGPIKTDT